ncbi:MAG: hypothetical protein F6K28_51305, partial [Microcoleus sp. SIO2G3]|nr:hypothetical protein [Microcoleus sp. SIO2G3]
MASIMMGVSSARSPWLPQLSIMDRYILRELLLPFLFGVGVFSSLGVSAGALFELIRRLADAELEFSIAA